ncbi:unnamed protein product [Psylliodes chrysocephalus]|uniref:Uncharacterized protein n=1 Tax=Psylliodes chrysocephalus TaxID=3402493 RepID=A0A9P0CXP7_9CUCU|nr:unnamed protein product [Psylliodes chrysocephala]
MSYRGRGNPSYYGNQDRVYYNREYDDYNSQPSTSRGRGRGRGNRRGGRNNNNNSYPHQNNKNNNNDKRNDENTKSDKPEINNVPEPKHLSKTSSELTNDPLYEESFFKEFGSSLRRDVDDPKIHSGTTGLKYIIENLYKIFVTKAAGFAKRMPESALADYCAILTTQRLLKIHIENSFDANYETTKFVRDIDNAKYFYPKTLSRYLSGFGNTRIVGGRSLKFYYPPAVARKVTVDDLRWWGRVNDQTHHLYLNYPCTAVYYSRVVHDYVGRQQFVEAEGEEEEEEDADEDLDLPARIRPLQWDRSSPNVNLQGWKSRTHLTNIQRGFLDTADFDPRESPRGLEWNYNPSWINAVSIELENLNFIEAGTVAESSGGSQGQTTFAFPYSDDELPVSTGDFIGKSNLDVSGPIANLGVKHLYRVKYDEDLRNWSIYWENRSFDHVPAAWSATVNTWRDAEYPELTTGRYSIELFDPREFARLVVERNNRKVKK